MHLTWTCDLSPYSCHSLASRNLVVLIPCSRYVYDPEGRNLTLQCAAECVARSFQALGTTEVFLRHPVTQTVAPRPPWQAFRPRFKGSKCLVGTHVASKLVYSRWPRTFVSSWATVVTGRPWFSYSTSHATRAGIRPAGQTSSGFVLLESIAERPGAGYTSK